MGGGGVAANEPVRAEQRRPVNVGVASIFGFILL